MSTLPDAFARLLCGYCLDVQAGQQVLVRSTALAAPLLLALQRELLEREAWPLLRTALPGQDEGWWSAVRDAQLDAYAPAELAEAEALDALLSIQAPESTTALAGVDPARMARAARARAPVREASLRRRWCGTLWPTPAGRPAGGDGDGGVHRLRPARDVPGPGRSGRRVGLRSVRCKRG